MIELLFAITAVSLTIATIASVVAWRAVSEQRRRSNARIARLADAIRATEPPDSTPVAAPHLFEPAVSSGNPRSTAMLAAAIGLAFLAVVAVTGITIRSTTPSPAADVSSDASNHPQPAMLELVSLTHERSPSGELELHGEVHNPQNGTTLENVTAMALLFDRQGTFVTSSRAPLETRTIAHGSDATFVITVPDAAGVGRYRVSFRTGDRIIPHTDRRDEH